MPQAKDNQILLRLIKDVAEIRAGLRQVTSNFPLYDIANENTPTTLAASQNNYAPGNFDVLRINALANVSITGISGGKKGRFLEIINASAFKITLPHESVSSAAANRFATVGSESIVLFPTARVRAYYDSTNSRWQIPDRPSWNGTYGVSLLLSNSVDIAVDGPTKLTFDTVTIDEWSMWDSVNQKIVIPASGVYPGVLMGGFESDGVGGAWQYVSWDDGGGGGTFNGSTNFSDAMSFTEFSCPIARYFTAGDTVVVYAGQNSGSPVDFQVPSLFFTRIL